MASGEFEVSVHTLRSVRENLWPTYSSNLISTRLGHNLGPGFPCQWRRGEKLKYIQSLEDEGVPHHFAYIKFCVGQNYGDSASDDEIFPLVAGKTSYRLPAPDCAPYKTDLNFSENGKGFAKQWLRDHPDFLWYTEKILVIWTRAAEKVSDDKELKKLAYDVERDISGLFGLFSS